MQQVGDKPLSDVELDDRDAYWRAANFLSVGQIYLLGNALLREPLRAEDVKPRLLGHWGTTPGLNMLYAHLNRVIRQRDLSMIVVILCCSRRGESIRCQLGETCVRLGVASCCQTVEIARILTPMG
ncbi:hypothetical protein [Kribbella sp. NBC_00889]|uniref:hypothetical protein n=1 Tax=Kribbella sp. NBC_00889 TaxID=2975974 RepID=UPI003870E8F4|nr:hypothetical protein OG817_13400 [Kribbella sp. NBC_00889]